MSDDLNLIESKEPQFFHDSVGVAGIPTKYDLAYFVSFYENDASRTHLVSFVNKAAVKNFIKRNPQVMVLDVIRGRAVKFKTEMAIKF